MTRKTCHLIGCIFCAAMVVALSGCATMHSRTINEDGSSHEHGVTVPPFSKQDLADFGYEQEVHADGSYRQVIGSRGEGMDTTGQLEAFKGLMALGQMIAPLIGQRQANEIQTPDGQRVDVLKVLADIVGTVNRISNRLNEIEGKAPATPE